MTVIERFGVPEPQWILDRTESGPMFWRTDNSIGKNARVKFRCDVEVKEFCPEKHEYEIQSEDYHHLQDSSHLTMAMTCLFCITVTVLLPWCLLGFDV